MANRAVPFTASGSVHAADVDCEIWGLVYKGFTSVNVYDGTDNTGNLLLAGGTAPVSILLNNPIYAEKGVYVEIAGTGKGSVLF